jgi:ankyrin repeat protein
MDQGERAIETDQPCPLCEGKYPPKRLQRHLGKQLEQIALFVIPGSMEDEDNDEEEYDKEDADDEDKNREEDQQDTNNEVDEKGPEAADKNNPNPEAEQHGPLVDQRAFFEAAENGDIETVKLAILQDHHNINAQNSGSLGKAALIYAYIEGQEAIMKLLLERKDFLVNTQDIFGDSALSRACYKGYENS